MVKSRMTMAAKIQESAFWRNIPFKGYLYSSFVINFFTIILVVGIRGFLPPVLPLLYGKPEGSLQLIPSIWLTIAPATSLVLTFLNLFLTKKVKDKFMQQVLIISTLVFSMLSLITVLKIIFLVGFF